MFQNWRETHVWNMNGIYTILGHTAHTSFPCVWVLSVSSLLSEPLLQWLASLRQNTYRILMLHTCPLSPWRFWAYTKAQTLQCPYMYTPWMKWNNTPRGESLTSAKLRAYHESICGVFIALILYWIKNFLNWWSMCEKKENFLMKFKWNTLIRLDESSC